MEKNVIIARIEMTIQMQYFYCVQSENAVVGTARNIDELPIKMLQMGNQFDVNHYQLYGNVKYCEKIAEKIKEINSRIYNNNNKIFVELMGGK